MHKNVSQIRYQEIAGIQQSMAKSKSGLDHAITLISDSSEIWFKI